VQYKIKRRLKMAKSTKRVVSYSEIEDKYASYYLLDDKVITRLEKALKKLKENKSNRGKGSQGKCD